MSDEKQRSGSAQTRYRVGRKVGNTLYLDDQFVGSCVTAAAASALVEATRCASVPESIIAPPVVIPAGPKAGPAKTSEGAANPEQRVNAALHPPGGGSEEPGANPRPSEAPSGLCLHGEKFGDCPFYCGRPGGHEWDNETPPVPLAPAEGPSERCPHTLTGSGKRCWLADAHRGSCDYDKEPRSGDGQHRCELDGTPTVAIPTCPKCGEEYLNEEGAAASDARKRRERDQTNGEVRTSEGGARALGGREAQGEAAGVGDRRVGGNASREGEHAAHAVEALDVRDGRVGDDGRASREAPPGEGPQRVLDDSSLVEAIRRLPMPPIAAINAVANAFRGSTAYLHTPDGRGVKVGPLCDDSADDDAPPLDKQPNAPLVTPPRAVPNACPACEAMYVSFGDRGLQHTCAARSSGLARDASCSWCGQACGVCSCDALRSTGGTTAAEARAARAGTDAEFFAAGTAGYRAALEKIAGHEECTVRLYEIAADALCWARKLRTEEKP